jgi:SsrA-binding protein
LKGSEVKSLREGRIMLSDSFCRVEKNEVLMYNCHINTYSHTSSFAEDSLRSRRLLLHKKEIRHLDQEVSQKALTIIPLRMYFNDRGWAKVEIALCKGKQAHDRREDIRKREIDKKIRQALKIRNR